MYGASDFCDGQQRWRWEFATQGRRTESNGGFTLCPTYRYTPAELRLAQCLLVDRTEVASDENNITVQGIREKSQTESAREAKLATAGLQTNSTTLCFVGLVNPRVIQMQLYQ